MENLAFTKEEKTTLEALGVEAVILFGSRALGLAGLMSDTDIGVLVRDSRILQDRAKRNKLYDDLYDIFSALVGRAIKRLSNIDIVFLQDEMVNLQLKYHVSNRGTPLYERDTRAFADFKEYIMERYADFAPLRRMFNEAILARV